MNGFEPEPRAKAINLRLVMENSLTKAELAAFNALDDDEAGRQAGALKTLHLQWLNIKEICNLETFEAAEVVYLQYNRIPRIENLDCLPKLQFLALQGNCITVIENLDCLRELEFLDLSKNMIEELSEEQIPETVNMLNLKGNPCTEVQDYKLRLQRRLPDLWKLDGEDLGDPGSVLAATVTSANTLAEPEPLKATEQGLGAYYRKGELQSLAESTIRERIEAYSIEALADVEGFDQQVNGAASRSRCRREGFEAAAQKEGLRLTRSTPQGLPGLPAPLAEEISRLSARAEELRRELPA